MAGTVFDLYAKLGINTDEFYTGLNNAESSGSKFGTGLKSAAKLAGVAITAATGAVVSFGTKSVQTGMEFDNAMSQVAATLGVTTDEIADLRDFAQDMGSTTAFSATQAAEALNYMALAGYDSDKSMQMLPTVLNLAAAGAMDLATASDMVTDAETALGLQGDQTIAMVDQMAKTASTTNTSVQQLGEAFLTIGGTAQYMAGGTEELSQVLGILADNGIKGSEAGTHLRNMLLKLSAPTADGAKMIEQLGLQVFDAAGNMRSFQDIFADLNTAMADFTDEQKINAFSTLFNSRDVAAANALLGTTADRWNEVGDAISGAEGSAEQMAETQLDNLAGDITLFKSALEGAQIAISDSLSPELRGFVQFGSDAISRLTSSFQEGGITGLFSELGTVVSEAASMIIKELPTMIRAGGELLKSLVTGLLSSMPDILDAAIEVIMELANFLAENASLIIPAVVDLAVTVIEKLTSPDVLVPLLTAVYKIIDGVVEGLSMATPKLIPLIIELIVNVVDTMVQMQPVMLATTINVVESLIIAVLGLIGGFFGDSYAEILDAWNNFTDWIGDAFENLLSDIGNFGADVLEDVGIFFSDLWDDFTGGLGDIIDEIGDFGADMIDNFFSIFDDVKGIVSDAVDTLLDMFDFDWSLPQIKLPHFSVSGGEAPWGFAGQGSFPKVAVQWYAKAMNTPYLLDSATIFGYAGGRAMGGGEAGDEMIYGKDALMADISAVVDAKLNQLQFVVPVYIGGKKIDQQIVTATARANVLSGGR